MNEPELIAELVRSPVIAVVGLSDDPTRPSHSVSAYMQSLGRTILPVNPGLHEVLGVRSYASLAELPVKPDLVNVFRLPRFLPAIVDAMVELGLKALWMQQGIVDKPSAERAEAHGIRVVMDRCLMVEARARVTQRPSIR